MAAKIIDGKKIASLTRADIASRVAQLKEESGVAPGLAVIIVGNDPASQVYVRNKKKACEEAGMYSVVIEMPEDTTQEALMEQIETLKENDRIHGILVQLPLPAHLDEEAVINAAKTCGAVVTAEEHQLAGGLFGAVSETLVQHSPVPMEAVAVRDTFGESGAPEALMDAYGLNAKAIVQAVRRVLARKG